MNCTKRLATRVVAKRAALTCATAVALTGCATLPTNGPSGSQVVRSVKEDNALGFEIIDIDAGNIGQLSVVDPGMGGLSSLAGEGTVDGLGPGDVLSIQIYEVGASLFGGGRASIGVDPDVAAAFSAPSASSQDLAGGVTVDRNGQITVPYAGTITVAGLTPKQVQDKILAGLRGKSQSPQVIVSLRRNIANTVVVMGAVARPGRLPLSLAREHLLDALAEAGGISAAFQTGASTATGTGPQDMLLRMSRGGRTVEQPLDTVRSGSPDDLLLLPGDRIEVVRQPRTFTVFGAIDRVSQMPFESQRLSLTEALARAGGPNDARADPRSVFVFRLPPTSESAATPGSAPKPLIYRINMMRAQSYFLAQRFAMRDKDVIYIANAKSNQPLKLVQVLSQLFTPVLAVRAVTQ